MTTNKKSYPRLRNTNRRFFPDFSTFSLFHFFSKFLHNNNDEIYFFNFLDQFPRVLEKNDHEQKVLPSRPEYESKVFSRLLHFFTFSLFFKVFAQQQRRDFFFN